ncbi:MAG: hypothetical protein AABY22_33720 [Nanoarchaeota archaeon]
MKIWQILAIIETEDDETIKSIKKKIDKTINCGDGIYIKLDETSIKFIDSMSDEMADFYWK